MTKPAPWRDPDLPGTLPVLWLDAWASRYRAYHLVQLEPGQPWRASGNLPDLFKDLAESGHTRIIVTDGSWCHLLTLRVGDYRAVRALDKAAAGSLPWHQKEVPP